MFKGRSIEFFEGDNGRLSMTRLLCYISIWPASYALYAIKTEGALAYYIGAYVLGYIGGKGADVWAARVPQPQTTQTITHTETSGIPDISIKADGDVNVNKTKRKK